MMPSFVSVNKQISCFRMVTDMDRPLVWFVLKVKPILLVTLQVKIHTHQQGLIQGSDFTMAIQEHGNHLEEVLVGGMIKLIGIFYHCY